MSDKVTAMKQWESKGVLRTCRNKLIKIFRSWKNAMHEPVLSPSHIKGHVKAVHLDTIRPFELFDQSMVQRVIDIGCCKGQHIKNILKPTFPNAYILGIDPKSSNYEDCLALGMEDVDFKKLDCRALDTENVGIFDFVWCHGLIYHLDDPTALMRSLQKITHEKSIINIEGHIAVNGEQACLPDPNPPIEKRILDGEDYCGKIAPEFDQNTTQEEKDKLSESALDNIWAFWLTYDSMIKLFVHHGFQHIIEIRVNTPTTALGPGLYFPHQGRKSRFYDCPPLDLTRVWSRSSFLISRSPFKDIARPSAITKH